jgi:hypothetical protein
MEILTMHIVSQILLCLRMFARAPYRIYFLSLVHKVISLTTGVWFPAEENVSLPHHCAQTDPEAPKPPIQWDLSSEVERPEREANHSTSSIARIKNACNFTSTPPTWVVLRNRHKFTFLPKNVQGYEELLYTHAYGALI